MKKDNFSISLRSSLALILGAAFLTPTHLLASGFFEDDGAALVATPAKSQNDQDKDVLRSLTNISAQLQEHAQRAEDRVRKVTKLVAAAAQDIAEDDNSIDFKALVKTAMPNGTDKALYRIFDAHERIAGAYNLVTLAEKLNKDLEDARQEVTTLKTQAGKSSDEVSKIEDQHKAQLKAITEEKDKEIAAKQHELDEAKDAHQKAITAVTQEKDLQLAAKQQDFEKANTERADLQANFQKINDEKGVAEQKVTTLIQSVKALHGRFDGKDFDGMDENTAKEMLKAIQAQLAELVK
ncbi:MAG: hypothetical protein BGO77_01090 [Caedibacter sp. 37-49]|nr:MAG: hypothetical protein BGO77_01090 [Caedibacter sp. 37-49]